jgi:hypothetical protein
MGFGAFIASGDQNKLLREDLVGRITEVRVEQSLDDPTSYAIRLEDDICSNDFEVMNAVDLKCGVMMAIAVKAGDQIKCLVRGPITHVRSSFTLGGPGSWYEIHGEDRRVEMHRQYFQRRWLGLASDAAQTILSPTFQAKVEPTNIIYGSKRTQGREVLGTLNQCSTDADFIAFIARANNLHFWLEYKCSLTGDSLMIEETANVKPSPPRPNRNTPDSEVKLVRTTNAQLRVNVPKDDCPNVTAFSLHMDAERPNRFPGAAIDDREVKKRSAEPTDPQPAITPEGARFPENPGSPPSERDACVVAAGNPEEVRVKAEASLTEAAWFLNATASTTAHMLNDVLLPHDVIDVRGLGAVHSGPYQVRSVTHVINAADHFMDLELRRNSIGKK